MMKLVSELLDSPIEFNENYINILEINDKKLFNKMVYSLNKSINLNEDIEGIYLLENNTEINLSKNSIIIYDFFNIDVNQSKMLKALYEDIAKEYRFNYDDETIISIQKNLIGSVREILMEYDYEFTQKETVDIKDLLKIMELKFDINYYDKSIENIFLLIDLVSAFNLYKLVVLVNAKCYFNSEEINEIYKMSKYKRINLLLVEFYKDETKKTLENKILIDEDFDEFNIK